jgi:large subunit ribosomal protein L24
MKIKKNDTVITMSGKDRGKRGKVMQVFPKESKIVVEGVNKAYRHTKARRGKEKGERIEFNAPIYASNAMILCSKCNKPSRVGFKIQGDERKRFCKKCKEVI